ncbi:hypothetical protein sscle_06g054890 [Sclerotinia sclerotiorum 1980 UF-70]|uniref:Uncharacterized protein n=1 Tax=Sclerotinia sclerotiorum (strain ATCC 18683 / 1980 / Ss-1) TaxID=665079 RepID=A0A1D9Q752_SCLS1|nr:hypothetical protein sscle_06g054890 [Sclerotinia sclerotiorum 1980 UF-70]
MSKHDSKSISPLHRQKVKGRDIVITEDPRLHLVWYHDRIFIKPLPKYLLSHYFWEAYLCINRHSSPEQITLQKAVLGYLRTYIYLIKYESDFRIAIDDKLQLIPPDITFLKFCDFIASLENLPDIDVSGRYAYGEIRLTRLNLYSKIFLKKFSFHRVRTQYSDYFASFYGPLLFVFAIVSVVLSAMQVSMAINFDVTKQWKSFEQFCQWFSIICLSVVAILVLWLGSRLLDPLAGVGEGMQLPVIFIGKYNTYVPTAPRSRRATTQKHSFPVEEQHIVPDRRLFDDTQRSNDGNDSGSKLQGNSNKENVADNDYNIDLPTLDSISRANTGEGSNLETKIWEDKIASPRIYDGDSSSIETVLDPRLYQETLIEELQNGYNTQDTLMLEDDKSNPDEQENFSAGGSHSPPMDYSIEPSCPLTLRDQDKSDSSYSDPEKLGLISSPYFLQQYSDIAVGSIKEGGNNEQQGGRKRRHLSETGIERDGESNGDARLANQRRTRSLSTNNEQTSSRRNGGEGRLLPRHITSSSFTAPSTMIDSSTSNFGGHSPAISDGNHCYPPPSSVNPICAKPATTTEYRECPFQGFLKRTIIGNDTTYTLEFQLQHVPGHLHLPVIAEALGADTFAQT